MKDKHENKQTTTSTNRRRIVLGSLGGVAVWQTPLIKSVVLPAHAQASMMASSFFAANVAPMASTSPLDMLVTPAYAGVIVPSEYTVEAIQQTPGGDTYDVGLFEVLDEPGFDQAEILYGGTLTVGTGGTLAVAENPCDLAAEGLAAEIAAVSNDILTLNLTGRGQILDVPAGDGMLPFPACIETPLPDNYFIAGEPVLGPQQTMDAGSKKSILDYFISSANAQQGPPPASAFGLSAAKLTETTYNVEHLNARGNVLRAGTLNVNGDPGSLVFESDACNVEGGAGTIPASIISIDQNEIVVQIQQSGEGGSALIDITAPVGPGDLMPVCNFD